ncbi:PREDICTED: testis-expressed sequence 13A protein-like [Elephantulus edwardii]|uniref:testis-expressed sequence 13A protein-like n=1 Tax=Elephantulus edwardii TaxID=28737 RepID=UPI0003F0E6F8|nr:PREDICTED: testis-expressed sequence 13A protein-like [Elephantulus edwardii]
MALNFEDPCCGFHSAEVVAFINKKMAEDVKGPEFYFDNRSLSWNAVENKLETILKDSTVSMQAKQACAWSGLALSVRFSRRQRELLECRVQWLHDFARLHKSAALALAKNLKELTERHELENKKTATQLQLLQTSLKEVQKERDLLRWKFLQAGMQQQSMEWTTGSQSLTTASGSVVEGQKEEEVVATGWPRLATASETKIGGESEEDPVVTRWLSLATSSGTWTEESKEEKKVVTTGWPNLTTASEARGEEVKAEEEVVATEWLNLATTGEAWTKGKGKKEKKPLVTDWLSLLIASRGREEVEGEEEAVATEWSNRTTVSRAGTEQSGKKEVVVAGTATAAPATTTTGGKKNVAGTATTPVTETAEELGGRFMDFLGAMDWKKFTTTTQESELRSIDTSIFSFPKVSKEEPPDSQTLLPIQLPASFSYSYSFPDPPTPSPTTSSVAAPPPKPALHWGRSNRVTHRIDPQETQRRRRDAEPSQQRRAPLVRRLGDWDCPWCKAVNFSRRNICFRCGRGIWLQNS